MFWESNLPVSLFIALRVCTLHIKSIDQSIGIASTSAILLQILGWDLRHKMSIARCLNLSVMSKGRRERIKEVNLKSFPSARPGRESIARGNASNEGEKKFPAVCIKWLKIGAGTSFKSP